MADERQAPAELAREMAHETAREIRSEWATQQLLKADPQFCPCTEPTPEKGTS